MSTNSPCSNSATHLDLLRFASLRLTVAHFSRLLEASGTASGTATEAEPVSDAMVESINVQAVCKSMQDAPRLSGLKETEVHHFLSVVGMDECTDRADAACIYRACHAAYRRSVGASRSETGFGTVSADACDSTRLSKRSLDAVLNDNIRMCVYDVEQQGAGRADAERAECVDGGALKTTTKRGRESDRDASEVGDEAVAEMVTEAVAEAVAEAVVEAGDESVVQFKKDIFEFYRRYAAHRLRKNGVSIPKIAEKYNKKRDLLNRRLKNIYGANLETMALRQKRSSAPKALDENTKIDILDRLRLWSMES